MPVPLSVRTDGTVVVTGYLSSERYEAKGAVTFLLDTGSQRTILGPRDAEMLRFPTSRFPPYTGSPLIGIGGKGKPFDVGPCQIVLGDAEIVDSVQVLYFKPEKESKVRTRGAGLRRETRERVFAIPSLLGVDILLRNRCALQVDYGQSAGEIRRTQTS